MAVNPTYKHLEASLRLGAFSLGQWAQVLLAVVLALTFGIYLSPLPLTPTIFVSIVLAGSPLALSYGAMAQEWSVTDALGAQWRWLRRPRCYLPGPSDHATGYIVLAEEPAATEPTAGARAYRPADGVAVDQSGEPLWDV